MVCKATKFTPGVLLSAPRRSAGAPNPSGDKVLYTVSTYSFEERRKTSQIRVLDIASGASALLYEDLAVSEPTWIGDDEFLFLRAGDKGTTSLLLGRASAPGAAPTTVQTVDGGLANLSTLRLDDGALAIALTGPADPSGALYNPDADESKRRAAARPDTAHVYDALYVRHWDAYVSAQRQAIWYGRLERGADGAYAVVSTGPAGGLTNLLAGTGLESPVPPFGGADDFALGRHGIAFVARDPAVNGALHTVSRLYFVPLQTYGERAPRAAPYAVRTGALGGYSGHPAFSPDGRQLVFTRMRDAQYESDKTRLLLVPDVGQLAAPAAAGPTAASDVVEFFATADGVGRWDASPSSILWSADGAELFVTAERHGRNALHRLPSNPRDAAAAGLPQLVVGGNEVLEHGEHREHGENGDAADAASAGFRRLRGLGSVSSVQLLARGVAGDRRLFLSGSSLVDSSLYSIVDVAALASPASPASPAPTLRVVSSQSRHGAALGLSPAQVGETWFRSGGDDGGDTYPVHALVVRPSGFDAPANKGRRWPLALLIHGGPQGAWLNAWSTRWSPAVFAEQGYVVVAPNPTGSSGYGMALQDGIQHQWGGRPYRDLVRAVEHVEATMPYVDTARAVALGASYGGFMINWIQGHPLGRRFKALVCHDGVFCLPAMYSTEELFFPIHEFGGTLWDNRAGYDRWDPSHFTGHWSTPQLVIHNELDYRLPIAEGLAAFNVLQSRNVPSKFVSFPDENHWVLKPENSLVWHREVIGWINKYSGVEEDAPNDTTTDTESLVSAVAQALTL